MATCVVCDAYFERGFECPRCGTNNRDWFAWRGQSLIEQEGLRGLLAFTEPHFHLPFIITALTPPYGLLFTFSLWAGIKPGIRALVIFVAPLACLVCIQGIYEARMDIRRKELLRRTQRGWRNRGLSARAVTILLPALAIGLVVGLALLLIKVDVIWKIIKTFVLSEPPKAEENFMQKLLAVMPFISLLGYVVLSISLTTSSSLMLARRYMNQLDEFLPRPIFLQGHLLREVVQREAERAVRRPITPEVIGDDLEPREWIWDEMKRMDDGGIELKAIAEKKRQDEETIGDWTERTIYTIKADPWSRITQISQEEVKS